MSTHASLIIKNPKANGGPQSWGVTLVHFDGYPAGVGAMLKGFHSSTEHAAALLAAGDINAIRDAEILHHDKLDQKEPEWCWTEEDAKTAAKYSAGAYYYIWNGKSWRQLSKLDLSINY